MSTLLLSLSCSCHTARCVLLLEEAAVVGSAISVKAVFGVQNQNDVIHFNLYLISSPKH